MNANKKMKVRHFGLVVKDLKETVRFYQELGFKILKRSIERWVSTDLEVLKMQNGNGDILELILGDWQPHISFTSEETPNMLWEKFGGKANQILTVKRKANLFIVYLRDPSGNYVEIVHEQR